MWEGKREEEGRREGGTLLEALVEVEHVHGLAGAVTHGRKLGLQARGLDGSFLAVSVGAIAGIVCMEGIVKFL